MKFIKIYIKKKSCWRLMLLFFYIVSTESCKKLVESPPPVDVVTESNVYSVDATAIAVFNGIYTGMNNAPFQGRAGLSLITGLSADELSLYSLVSLANLQAFHRNALTSSLTSNVGSDFWTPFYLNIFKCNAAIEGLNSSNSKRLTIAVKQQLLGEAKFMRAFFYFYLVNLFGDVPLALTTDVEVNVLLPRSSRASVYHQIIADLKDAEELLSPNYLNGTLLNTSSERVRPIKWAATAMLARVYLYTGEYTKAEEKASAVIDNTALYGPLSSIALNSVFLKNSKEAIWQVQPTDALFNTFEARTFVLNASGPNSLSNPVFLSTDLLNSFEAGDKRAINGNWVNTRTVGSKTYKYPTKYKINTQNSSISGPNGIQNMSEYFMVLRLGEQCLIRAEARARLNNITGAQSDLNAIRTRAGLANTVAGDQSSLLTAILHERQVELFTEWGHRWLDLKRTGTVDAVMNVVTPQKASGAPWKSYQQLYPILYADILKNPNLTQNAGY